MPEYSVLKPATSSCSASSKSNGGRSISAVPASRKMKNGMNPVTRIVQFGRMSPGPEPAC